MRNSLIFLVLVFAIQSTYTMDKNTDAEEALLKALVISGRYGIYPKEVLDPAMQLAEKVCNKLIVNLAEEKNEKKKMEVVTKISEMDKIHRLLRASKADKEREERLRERNYIHIRDQEPAYGQIYPYYRSIADSPLDVERAETLDYMRLRKGYSPYTPEQKADDLRWHSKVEEQAARMREKELEEGKSTQMRIKQTIEESALQMMKRYIDEHKIAEMFTYMNQYSFSEVGITTLVQYAAECEKYDIVQILVDRAATSHESSSSCASQSVPFDINNSNN